MLERNVDIPTLTEEQRGNAKKWVVALRSKEYPQGTGYLCNVTEEGCYYCCLGVGVDVIHGKDAWKAIDRRGPMMYQGTLLVLQPDTMDALGIDNKISCVLSDMNDNQQKTFDEIADFIEIRLGLLNA